MSIEAGTLYVVATPIGNLGDLTPRAQQVLQAVVLIAAEDTRHSRPLLQHFGIHTPLQSLHEHNEQQASAELIRYLQAGNSIALISDAGTPLISDPGYHLIRTAHQHRIPVVPIPGPSALISALSAAGLPADRFIFEGFLPSKAHARRQHLQTLIQESRTLVFYEAPHRLLDTLHDMADCFGETRIAVLVKELTKRFETVYRASLAELSVWLHTDPQRQKGEFVLVVAGAPPADPQTLTPEAEHIFRLLRDVLPLKQAARLASDITGLSRNRLYQHGLDSDGSGE